MATLLQGILETHQGPEPRVLTEDVQAVLRAVIRPDDDDAGKSVALIAERAEVSTRTVYRVLNPTPRDDGEPPTIGLDLADKLCIAAGAHLRHVRLYWPDGGITTYDTL
jgi:hypothetical protein